MEGLEYVVKNSVKISSDNRLSGKIRTNIKNTNNFCWSIKFNQELDPKTVNIQNVRIIDEEGVQHPTQIKYNHKTRVIGLIPEYDYEEKTNYYLILGKKVASSNGKTFANPLYINFAIESGLLTGIRVLTHNESLNIQRKMNNQIIQNTTQSSAQLSNISTSNNSNIKYLLLPFLLLLLLLPFAIFFYNNNSEPPQSLDSVMGRYGWRLAVTGKYSQENGDYAYWNSEKLTFKDDAYKIHLINTGTKTTDIKLEIFDDLGELRDTFVLPREHISGRDVKIKTFKIDFIKRRVYDTHKNLTRDLNQPFNFDSIVE